MKGYRLPRQLNFRAMTRAQRRVAVARDILAQLEHGQIKAKRLTYFKVTDRDHAKLERDREEELRAVLPKLAKPCHVCALGSAVLSRARLFDKTRASEVYFFMGSGEVLDLLNDTFTVDQACLIEDAFEGPEEHTADKLRIWLKSAPKGARARLQAIWTNVARNGGEFEPRDLRSYTARGPWRSKEA